MDSKSWASARPKKCSVTMNPIGSGKTYGANQCGGTMVGIIVGLVLGLAMALCIAVYVTQVPSPFVNKVPSRSLEQDAEEAKKNKNWDPNAPLYGKNPARAASSTAPVSAAIDASPAVAVASRPQAASPAPGKAEVKNPPSADPLGDLMRQKSTAAGLDPFTYHVQAGAFRTPEDAEAQRAKLSLLGLEAKVSEREQSGRTVYRVRLGPFDKQDEAEKAKTKLESADIEAALVRVQR